MIRPFRDPSSNEWDSPETRANFVPKAMAVHSGAYKSGAHIDLRYDSKGEVVSSGEGETVVEYIRCGGWEWVPIVCDIFARIRSNRF